MRVRNVTYTRQKKKKSLRRVKGAYATKKNRWRYVKQHLRKVLEAKYVGRKDKKGTYRRIWITRINAASRELADMSYGQFIHGLKKANVAVDRKILADIAVNDPKGFKELTEIAKQSATAA